MSLPEGLEPDLEIEIVNPDDVTMSVDGVEIDLMPDAPDTSGETHESNLAEFLDDDTLNILGMYLLEDVDNDILSRSAWSKTYVEGLHTLGLNIEERSEPWAGACGLTHPMLLEAAVRFQSETIMETFPAGGPVGVKIIGKESVEKLAASKRVKEDMNYRLTEQMQEYRTEHEKMLFNLALAGAAFKKVYDDRTLGRPVSVFIPAEDLIMPYACSSVTQAYRKTHRMRKTCNEVKKLQIQGFYREVELPEPTIMTNEIEEAKADKEGVSITDDDRHTLYEIHCEMDLPGYEDEDGVKLPYVITVDASSGIVLSIYRNWLEDDILFLPRQHFTGYSYVTANGAYGFGLIHLVGALAKGATSILRQLIDAGTLSNLPGGFKTRGARIKGDDCPIMPGEFRDVDVSSGTLKDSIVPLPYKEPSQVLFALLNAVIDEGRRLAATADIKISDMSAEAPVGTTLALLERQLKVMGAVQARVHASMKEEFKLLKAVIRDNAPVAYEYEPDSGTPQAAQADYDMVDIIPVSDPNASTMTQRIAQLQAVIQMAQIAPTVYDQAELHRSAIELIGLPNAAKIVPLPTDKVRKPKDPVSENMAAMVGQPLKAFQYQDHKAHIAAHQAFLQDPGMQQILQGPTGQTIGPSIMAHIQEHMAFQYKQEIEALLGYQLPDDEEGMSEELEKQISAVMSQAGTALLQRNQQAAAQAQAQQAAQDPVIQAQQKELELKQLEMQRKGKNDQYDYDVALKRLELEEQRIQLEDQRIREKQRAQIIKDAAQLEIQSRTQP
jgi:hypothetical protein